MSMQGPRSLSNACTSITALLKRREGENEFKPFPSCKPFPKHTHSCCMRLHLGTPATCKKGCFYMNSEDCVIQVRDFTESSSSCSPHFPTALDISSFHTAKEPACLSCSQAVISTQKCLLKASIHPSLVAHINCLGLDSSKRWQNMSRLADGKKILHVRKRVLMHKDLFLPKHLTSPTA